MANISYGVNIIPKTNNTYSLGNSSYKWHAYLTEINGQAIEDLVLPTVTSSDNDKILKVSSGEWTVGDAPSGLPTVSSTDNGKILSVSSGTWAVATLSNATTTTNGLMSATDKSKLDGISANAAVSDVQIDSTSIVSNGTANIPPASSDTFGVIKVGTGLYTNSSGKLYTNGATSYQAKAGASNYVPIVPAVQHESVFYGLAKAAGDSTQSASSNSVGTYTANAQAAIQSMLAVAPTASPIFTGSISLGRAASTTVGTNSFAVGDGCEASAEEAHAEGRYTTASGYYSHAEGNYTFATGMAAHAEGTVTIANHASQHAFGEYNVPDSSIADAWNRGNYVEIVGNGTASDAQSNARALDWSGNEYLNGYLYVGCNASSGSGTRIPHDIQIDGTSIVSNGIATIPLAAAYQSAENPGHPGLVHPSADYGTKIQDNVLAISGATETDVKTGTTTRRPLTPLLSKNIVFYGLAKAAGDSTQSSSSNAIGTYTADAKSAIQSMLGISTMTGATSSVAGTSGLVPAPATTDVDKFLAGDGTYKSGGLPMVILSYGNSTWTEFENAYNNNVIVYTRASSNSNPATGSQTRMAFMAYVNNATTPTEVEFQYYRSMSSHSATAMGDQVFVYKLTKTGGWSVTTRDASIKQIKMDTGSAGSVSWSSNVVTLDSGLPAVTASDEGKILKVVNGAWAVVDP